jgi:hypothetical protein
VPGAGNPQALNRFSYVGNNPLRFTDPTGNSLCAHNMSCGNAPNVHVVKGTVQEVNFPAPAPPPPDPPGNLDPPGYFEPQGGSGGGESDENGESSGGNSEPVVDSAIVDALGLPPIQELGCGGRLGSTSFLNYDVTCQNLGMAVEMVANPNTPLFWRWAAWQYIKTEVTAHSVGMFGLMIAGVEPTGILDTDSAHQPNPASPIGQGLGGYGTASELGDMTGLTRSEADGILRSLSPERVHTTSGGYSHYRFADGSEIVIGPDNSIDRLPSPMYNPDGSRIKGLRIDPSDGTLKYPHTFPEERLVP